MRPIFHRWLWLVVATAFCLPFLIHSPAAVAYKLDTTNHTITVSPAGDYTKDARSALAYLLNRSDKNVRWTLEFQPGKYYLTLPLYGVGLQNVDIISNPSNPAQFIKAANFSGSDYLVYLRMSNGLKLRGFQFFGKTDFKNSMNPVWPDQGVFFGSCKDVTVDNNKFFNFGNAALRVTTSEMDPIKGVNSFDTVVTNNTFNNIYQISTTSNDNVHGATARYRMEYNTIVNLRGSVKFATRTSGAKDVVVANNNINGSEHFGLEIDNYDNFEIRSNSFQNIKSVAINIYTNDRAPRGFDWGNNYTITGNAIRNCGRGIRFSPDAFQDGYRAIPKNLTISDNMINTLTETQRYIPAIAVVNGKVDGVKILNNQLFSVANKNFIAVSNLSTNVSKTNNKADNQPLDSQTTTTSSSPAPSPAPAPAAAPPAQSSSSSGSSGSNVVPSIPSNVAAQYDGSSQVRITWKDNASNETAQEVWGSNDAKHFSLIARLYKDSQVFTHQLKRVPSASTFYYAVRAINGDQASVLSSAAKVEFH